LRLAAQRESGYERLERREEVVVVAADGVDAAEHEPDRLELVERIVLEGREHGVEIADGLGRRVRVRDRDQLFPCRHRGSFGRPSTRSPSTLRWISLEPP